MQRRRVQRAFSGLVGLPPDLPEPDETPVVCPLAAIAAPEPISATAPAEAASAPRGSISNLASLAYRPRRDLATGMVIETDATPVETHVHALRATWRSALASAGVNLYVKCVHGHMYSESYCDVCRLAPIDPDYDPDIYRTEIRKALKQAKKSLIGDEGKKDLRDLQQIIDIELWKASKKYGDQMNESLAFTIAKNQSGKYLTERIEEMYVEFIDADGNVTRARRFQSMDDKKLDEDGDETTTKAEIAVIKSPAQGTEFSPIDIESLQKLVATWRGEKKLVGEAMLHPGFNIRSVPGVPKSTVARVRQVILREFKSFISKGFTK